MWPEPQSRNEGYSPALRFLLGGLMLNSEEYRQIAKQYRERANSEKSTRLANVLLSVSNAYLALAGQLDLLASVERQEIARTAVRDTSKAKME
jgi:hypothetical protein